MSRSVWMTGHFRRGFETGPIRPVATRCRAMKIETLSTGNGRQFTARFTSKEKCQRASC
jgi:hypothetical protein